MSFFYDSNALWNKYIGENLRIIVIHNGGGNIFSMIKGPGETPAFQEHFFSENTYKAEGLAKAFGLEYFAASNESDLKKALIEFYLPDQKAAVLEVFTDAEVNVNVFRELFKEVKKVKLNIMTTKRTWEILKEYEDIFFEYFDGIGKITINRERYRKRFSANNGERN